jgi:hypothetical protein
MTVGALNVSEVPATLTLRDLRRDRALAPGGGRFGEVVRKFLPLVYGVGGALIPEDVDGAERVAVAVFETLAFRWRKISRKTAIATWLLRTTSYVAARERSRLGLKAASADARAVLARAMLKGVNGLCARRANAFVLCAMLGELPDRVAGALRMATTRFEKRYYKAVAKVTRRVDRALRKLERRGQDVGALTPTLSRGERGMEAPAFRSYAVGVAGDVEERVVGRIAQWAPKAAKDPLVRSAISGWRWLAIGRFFKRLGATVGTIVCVVILFLVTMKVLLDRGAVNMALLFMGQVRKDLLKDFPELKQAARPWPANPAEMALASTRGPADASQLYGMTNIWLVKLKLTPEQWAAVQPVKIPPAPQLPNGKMALRNSKASRSGLIGAMGLDFRWAEGALEIGERRFERVGIRYRGNGTYLSSLYGPKQSLKVDLNRLKKGEQVAGETALNFVNAIPDFSYLKDALAEKLFRELGAVAPRTAYAYVTLDVAGKFKNQPLGLYVMVEDIDGNFAKDRFGQKDVPIFKPVTYDLFDDWGKEWSAYKEIYDLKTKATKAQLARVVDFAQLVSHADDEEFARRLPEFLDFEEYAAFVAGHVLLSSYDGYLANGQNFYMYLDPRSNKFGFIPWDQDHAWGEFGYVDTADHREHASIWKPAAYKNKFLGRVMKVEAFKAVYRKKLEQALAGPFTAEGLNREVDDLAAVIRPAIAAESDFRLKRFEIAVSTNWVSGPRDAGKDWKSSEGPRAPAHQIKRFIEARTKSVREQLDGKEEGVLIRGFGEGSP